ncbi:hypothetical protein C1752_01373 [Acaryochloris thomasi RCC1774]|uniref:Steroid 5-alpha reductase C-terminal domain-containing protein n=2 Tax=Acaryochloris TaxID=155977 RepID=A0A2W1JMK3_9CYAN|nr:hypothetical protein C1752_01373 [Acaryochloris thomasi RCC1774]
MSLVEIGAGLAVSNWIVLAAIMVVGALSHVYRIQAEEEMLKAKYGKQYEVYSEKTWRLLPFIY